MCVVKVQSLTCFYCERVIFDFNSRFRVLSFCPGFWVSIKVIVCAICNVHSAHFVLHATFIAIMKELDNLLQSYQFYVGYGFWFLGCQFFALFCLVSKFTHYLIPICLN
jgi:hypothetical protein